MDSNAKPIFSSNEDDPSLRDPINAFVIGLGERVDLLQDAQAAGDFERLIQLSDDLTQVADELGYAPLAETARCVAEASHAQCDSSILEALTDLTHVGRRIRLGHRGAA